MYKKGDKFVMEIDEVIMFDEKVWYKTKGPNSFIIDQRGLDSLSQLVDGVDKSSELKGYSKGYAEGLIVGRVSEGRNERTRIGKILDV